MSRIQDVIAFREKTHSDFKRDPVFALLYTAEVEKRFSAIAWAITSNMSPLITVDGNTPLTSEAEVKFGEMKKWFEGVRPKSTDLEG